MIFLNFCFFFFYFALPIYSAAPLRPYQDSLKHITYMLLILYFFYLVILFFLFSHYNKIKKFLCREIKSEKMKTYMSSLSLVLLNVKIFTRISQQGMPSLSLVLLQVKIFTRISGKKCLDNF